MSSPDVGREEPQAPLRASTLTCRSCGGYVAVLPGWSIWCSTCKTTTTTTTTITKEDEQGTVPITVVPDLARPFAWWSEDHMLALRPCTLAELPGVLEAAAARIRETSPVAGAEKSAPRLYENSTRTDPVAGDIIRDSTGCAWRFGRDGRWAMASVAGVVRTPEAIAKYGPLLLLWDAAAGVMPEPTS